MKNFEAILADAGLTVTDEQKTAITKDDGYRGVHVYYQADGIHYPVEIQYNTYYDRQFNNWLHKYIYKKDYEDTVGLSLRKQYESAKILSEEEFKEALEYVLSSSKKCR